MKNLRQRKYLFALVALLVLFAGCRGESPTAPPPTGGPGPTPGGPAQAITLTLTVANPNPNAGSDTLISANVRQDGNPAPNGTAVEFSTNFGLFTDVDPPSAIVIKTTTNGVATARLTSASPGLARVTAVVGNVVAQVDVNFIAAQEPPVTPTPGPTISSISPEFGLPSGGETLTITGTGFVPPVKVFFNINGVLREAFVLSVTPTQIRVLTPQVDLGAGQTLAANIIVFTEQGTPTEKRVQSPTPFTFRRAVITPVLTTASPASGPIDGGTRVTIFGDAFEAPVQVFFGAAEAQVINTSFSQIVALSPPGRDTSDDGSGTVTGPVSLRVVNINSGTSATLAAAFRYTPKMVITAAGPTTGPALGGTRVRIDGIGFDQPVAVEIGGVAAQPVFVSGTQIIAVTGSTPSPCVPGSGPVRVVNIDNGDFAEGPEFTFIGINPIITSVTSAGPITPGSTITVTVADPGVGPLGTAVVRFEIDGRTVIPTPTTITQGTGLQTFTVVIPLSGFTFPTVECTTASGAAGTRLGPIDLDLAFRNVTTGCADVLEDAIRLEPPGPNPCLTPPSPTVTASPSVAGCAAPPPASVAAAPQTTTATITVSNAPDAQPLNVTAITIGGTNAAEFSVAPPTASNIPAGGSATFTLTFDPQSAGGKTANVNFTTNAPTQPPPLCVTATALP